MCDWSRYNRENIKDLQCEYYIVEKVEVYSRLSSEERGKMESSINKHNTDVQKKIADICFKYAKNTNNMPLHIGMKCNLSESIVRQVLNGKKKITMEFLGRLCVGLKLSVEESKELFEVYGIPLNFDRSYFDAITICAIRDKDDIEDYEDELKRYKR